MRKQNNFSKQLMSFLLSLVLLLGMFASLGLSPSATEVEQIDEVSININKPLIGWKLHAPDEHFNFDFYQYTITEDDDYYAYGGYYHEYDGYMEGGIIHNGVHWYEQKSSGYKRDVKMSEAFEEGKTYTVRIMLHSNDGYVFKPGTKGYINGKEADISVNLATRTCTLTYTFPTCKTTGDTIYIKDFDEPRAGANPDFTATAGGIGFYVNGTITWTNVTDGGGLKESDVFEAGKEYRALFFIRADDANGYTFTRNEDDEPVNMKAKINGMPVDLIDTPTGNGLSIMVEKTYVIDNVIESVDMGDINIPRAGEKPDMLGSINSDGCVYSMVPGADTIYWVEYDGYVDHRMDANATFEEGKTYGMRFCLFADEGYAFKLDAYDEVDVHATVNGMDAEAVISVGDSYCEFEWLYTVPISFDFVDITDATAPEAGAAVDKEVSVLQSQYCEETEVVWVALGTDDTYIYDVHTFSPGKQYTVQISLKAKDGYVFNVDAGYQEITATVNGKSAIAYGSHSETEAAVGYEFEALPQQDTKLMLKQDSGFVVDHNKKTVVIPKKTTSVTVKENITNENFVLHNNKGNDPSNAEFIGTDSRIQLTDTKGTVLDEYTVIVRYDADGNGEVQAADARLALRYSVKLETLVGAYFTAADIEPNGSVTAADARSILRHSVGLSD